MNASHPDPARETHATTTSPGEGPRTPSSEFSRLPSPEQVERARAALEKNGFHVVVVADRAAARRAVLELVPEHSEILEAASQTLAETGLLADLGDPRRFRSVRPQLMKYVQEGRPEEQRKIGAAPNFVLGSVHAVTESGQVVIASATGSQLGPYAYGAGKVIWVVGTQKIVSDLDSAMRRVHEYTFPLEDARARKVYGSGSVIGKLLIVNREIQPGRITLVLVQEKLGF